MSKWVSSTTFEAADEELTRVLNDGYVHAKEVLQRNRSALDALIEALLERNTMRGDEVRAVVEPLAAPEDIESRNRQRAEFM